MHNDSFDVNASAIRFGSVGVLELAYVFKSNEREGGDKNWNGCKTTKANKYK